MWPCPSRTLQPEAPQLLPSRASHRGKNEALQDPTVPALQIRFFSAFKPTLLVSIRINLRNIMWGKKSNFQGETYSIPLHKL